MAAPKTTVKIDARGLSTVSTVMGVCVCAHGNP